MPWQSYIFLALISPLWAWFNVWLGRSFYEGGQVDYYTKQWHFWQGAVRGLVVSYVTTAGWETWHYWPIALLWWAYDYIVYPGILNVFTFRKYERRGIFYVGRRGREDKHPDALQKWLLAKDKPELWLGCIKVGFLAVAVTVWLWT